MRSGRDFYVSELYLKGPLMLYSLLLPSPSSRPVFAFISSIQSSYWNPQEDGYHNACNKLAVHA